MPRLRNRPPKYRCHKASGKAVATVNGRDHYLGAYGSPESHQAYQRLVAAWSRQEEANPTQAAMKKIDITDLRICELLVRYFEFADSYYRKNGQPTGEVTNIREATRVVVARYGELRIADFGPTCLKAVREDMINKDLSRKVINARINRIRRVLKWGVENELVEPSVLQKLQAVAPLKKGRSAARETQDVKPVSFEHVEAVRSRVTAPILAMIDVQTLTAMRPGEVVLMKLCDVDRANQPWIYRPETHKTEHHGTAREIPIGPKSQKVLVPFLDRKADAYLFNPRESILERRRKRRVLSKSRAVRMRTKFNLRSLQRFGERYTTKSYQHAIQMACERAGIPTWGPNRLRHNFATELRRRYGIEKARAILGHKSAVTTEIYAEMDHDTAAKIIMQVG